MGEDKPTFAQGIAEELIGLAGEFVTGGIVVSVKTNLGPEVQIFDGEPGGLAGALGIKAGVIVRDKRGNVLARHGDPAPTEPLKVAALVVLLGLVAFVIVRGVLPK